MPNRPYDRPAGRGAGSRWKPKNHDHWSNPFHGTLGRTVIKPEPEADTEGED
jgi:hypothetical protein